MDFYSINLIDILYHWLRVCKELKVKKAVVVIFVCKGEQNSLSCFGLKAGNIAISVIGINCLLAVAVINMADAVQCVISVAHFQTFTVINQYRLKIYLYFIPNLSLIISISSEE